MNQENVSSPARRVIREAVIQLLHAQDTNPGTETDPWPLILTFPEAKITRARARALLHLQQNRSSRAKVFVEKAHNTLPLLESFIDDRSVSKTYRALVDTEKKLPDLLDLLRRAIKSSKEPEELQSIMERIRVTNQSGLEAITTLKKLLGPADSAPESLRGLAGKVPALLESSRLLSQILSPNPPELPELEALRKAQDECEQLKAEVEKLHQLVLKHLPSTDNLIADRLENFSPDRMNRVDRAILRLAATELHHCPEVPKAVAIDEAIEIAKRFSDTDSSSFVNGILDKLQS